MLGARPKKMMNLYILDILKRNTDANHPVTQKEIQQRLESEYDMVVDRKAIKANLEDLINDGLYNIEYATKVRFTPNAKTGELEKNEILTGFYYNNVFTDSELRLLMDSVLFSRSIPATYKKEVLGKLKGLSNKYFKFSTGNIQSYESVDREINKELFYTIEVLDEAISKGLQVKFLYNEYGTDKKLHHRLNEDGQAREYVINPYTMVANSGKYYLICNYDKYDNLSHYRLDRISNIELLDTPRKPREQVQGLVGLDVAQYMAEHIEKVLFAGEVMPAKQLNYWRSKYPNALFANLFGPTETTDICTYYIVDREIKDTESVPIGIACDNCDSFVVTEDGRLAGIGEEGELYARGSFLAMGYYNDPDKTAAAFVQNPLQSHYPERVYKTGDLVRWNERGELIYLSRRDFQIKHMGYRIELGEIEAAATAQPGVDVSVCLYDQAADQLILIYVGAKAEQETVRQALQAALPAYMLPAKVIQAKTIPYNQNGKTDRKALAAAYFNKAD